jgi:cyclin B
MVTSAQEECETAVPMDMSCTSHDGEEDTDEAFSKQMLKLNVHDIDQDDASNPQLVSEYVNDIYEYMRELELKFNIRPKCMANQTEINGRMRGILIDWLIQVHLRFQLLQETLYLTISILDRYLQVENVAKSKLQLVGVTCMWVACKYEEMYAPEVADFVYITDNAYSSTEMRQMECQILIALDFQLGRPLAIHFLRRNSKAGEVDATMHTMAKYLMELTVVDYDMVHLRPSEIAAAALCLAIKLISNAPWTPTLVYYSRYTEQQLMPIIRKMADLVLSAGTGKLTSIKGKYQSSKFMRISKSPVLESGLLEELCSDDTLLTAAL